MPFTRTGLAVLVTLILSPAAAAPGGSDYMQRAGGPDKAYDAPAGSKLKHRSLKGGNQTNSYRFAPAPTQDETPWHRMDCDTC